LGLGRCPLFLGRVGIPADRNFIPSRIPATGHGDAPAITVARLLAASPKRLSYAHAFAAALAKLRKAELLTGDPEFKAVQGDVKIHWLKR